MKAYTLSIVVLFVLPLCLSAQNVVITADPLVDQMMSAFISQNRSQSVLPGWRVQILATTDRERMESVQQSFRYHYPNIPVNWIHARPYYKLQAGAYRTKADALRLKAVLSREFDGLYLVRDENIQKSELLNFY